MKWNIIFLGLLSFLCIQSHSQTIMKTSPSNINPTELEAVQRMGEKWFKEIYVENFFKDPYSYRLLKITTRPITLQEASLNLLEILNYSIDTCSLSRIDLTQESYDACMSRHKSSESSFYEEINLSKSAYDPKEAEYHRKRAKIFSKYSLEYLDLARRISCYLYAVYEKERIEKDLYRLTPEESQLIIQYEIKIDCYSKNSLGNEVLGRFSFPFSTAGPLGEKNGVDKVVHLNK